MSSWDLGSWVLDLTPFGWVRIHGSHGWRHEIPEMYYPFYVTVMALWPNTAHCMVCTSCSLCSRPSRTPPKGVPNGSI